MKNLFILLLCGLQLCLFAQTASNPFDIEKDNRGATSTFFDSKLPPPTQEDQQNPFDVDTTRTTLKKKPVYINPQNELKTSDSQQKNSFIFWLSLFSLLITTIAITRDRKAFSNLPKLISNRNYLKLVNRDLNSSRIVFYILLYTSFFIGISAFIYLCANYFYDYQGLKVYVFILGCVILTYVIRHIALYLIKSIVMTKQVISDHSFVIMVANGITGILLIPANLLFNYADSFKMPAFYLTIAIIAIFYIWRQLSGSFLSMTDKHTNLFHFFIYICSFEIAPALIIIKLVQGYS